MLLPDELVDETFPGLSPDLVDTEASEAPVPSLARAVSRRSGFRRDPPEAEVEAPSEVDGVGKAAGAAGECSSSDDSSW